MADGKDKVEIEDLPESEETEEKKGDIDIEEVVLEEDEIEKKEDSKENEIDKKETIEIEETEKGDRDVLEKVVEEQKEEQKKLSKFKTKLKHKQIRRAGSGLNNKIKIAVAIILTIFITAAAVLGAMYYFNQRNNKEPELAQEEIKEETKEKNTNEGESNNVVYISPAVGLNLRDKPTTEGSEVLIIIPFGTKVPVVSEENGWIKTEYDEKEGWISSDFTQKTNPWVYRNDDYNFQLAFKEGWEGYKVSKEKVDGIDVFYVNLPTSEAGWVSAGADLGYSSMFAISVYTPTKWNEIKNSEELKPTFLKEINNYVFVWSSAQSRPEDLKTQFDAIKSIIDTFKLI